MTKEERELAAQAADAYPKGWANFYAVETAPAWGEWDRMNLGDFLAGLCGGVGQRVESYEARPWQRVEGYEARP
jgi:hypothetical protein